MALCGEGCPFLSLLHSAGQEVNVGRTLLPDDTKEPAGLYPSSFVFFFCLDGGVRQDRLAITGQLKESRALKSMGLSELAPRLQRTLGVMLTLSPAGLTR